MPEMIHYRTFPLRCSIRFPTAFSCSPWRIQICSLFSLPTHSRMRDRNSSSLRIVTSRKTLPTAGSMGLQHFFRPALERGFHLARELIRHRPVDQPMVEAQRQVADRPDRDGVVDNHRLLLHYSRPKNRHLRLINDGSRDHAAET